MSIIHSGTRAVRKLALKAKARPGHRRSYTQPILRVEEQGTALTQSSNKLSGWAFPAGVSLLGLGFSLFCTKQVVSCNGTIKAFTPQTLQK